MPTPEQNKQTVAAFAREVFDNKDLGHAHAWLAGSQPAGADPAAVAFDGTPHMAGHARS